MAEAKNEQNLLFARANRADSRGEWNIGIENARSINAL